MANTKSHRRHYMRPEKDRTLCGRPIRRGEDGDVPIYWPLHYVTCAVCLRARNSRDDAMRRLPIDGAAIFGSIPAAGAALLRSSMRRVK